MPIWDHFPSFEPSLERIIFQCLTTYCIIKSTDSQWPTIPQLYINGEFIGGCDIVSSMHDSGELSDLIKEIGGRKNC